MKIPLHGGQWLPYPLVLALRAGRRGSASELRLGAWLGVTAKGHLAQNF